MAITHVASAAGSTSNPTITDQVTLSGSIQTGDWIEVWVHNRYADQAVTLQGVTDDDSGGNSWTQKGESPNGRLTVWAKIATSATAGKTVTATLDSSAAVLMGYSAYRSDAGGFDIDTSLTNLSFEANTSGNETHAGFTPDAAGSLVGLAVAPMDNNAVSSQSCTDPGSLTERFDKTSTAAQDHALSYASAIQSGGPSATGDFTWSMTNDPSDSAVHALKEVSGGAEVTLAATASGTSVASGVLTGSVPLAATTAGASTATASLTGLVPLTAVAGGASSGAGSLTVELAPVLLSGTAAGSSDAAGVLTGEVPLAGSAVGGSTGQAALTGETPLAGTTTGGSAATANLTFDVGLTGAASGSSTATAGCSLDVALNGTAAGSSTTTADLTIAGVIGLSGAASAVSTAIGDLTVQNLNVQLAGTSAGTSTATSLLELTVGLTATATGMSTATGSLLLDSDPPPRERLEASGLGYGSEASRLGTGLEGSSI